MSTTPKLAKLFKAISEADLPRAATLADELIREQERRGHRNAAATLRGSLNPNGVTGLHSLPQDLAPTSPTLLRTALSVINGVVSLENVRLRPESRKELTAVVTEWAYRNELASSGISRRSKLFFYGPPGCGKSLTALALGNELSLPTYLVRFDAVIGAYLGQTAVHLRELFRFAESTPCLLLFDEIDALGKRRGNPLDVGELDRIVISLMQELEHSKPEGIVVATSNLPEHLDHALWRRFDLTIEFPKPLKQESLAFGKDVSRRRNIDLPNRLLRQIAGSANYMAAEKIVESHARALAVSALSKNGG